MDADGTEGGRARAEREEEDDEKEVEVQEEEEEEEGRSRAGVVLLSEREESTYLTDVSSHG